MTRLLVALVCFAVRRPSCLPRPVPVHLMPKRNRSSTTPRARRGRPRWVYRAQRKPSIPWSSRPAEKDEKTGTTVVHPFSSVSCLDRVPLSTSEVGRIPGTECLWPGETSVGPFEQAVLVAEKLPHGREDEWALHDIG